MHFHDYWLKKKKKEGEEKSQKIILKSAEFSLPHVSRKAQKTAFSQWGGSGGKGRE